MNRRSFFTKLAAGVAIAPVVAMSKEPTPSRAVVSRLELPPEMGKVNGMAMLGDHIFFAAETSVWRMHKDELK